MNSIEAYKKYRFNYNRCATYVQLSCETLTHKGVSMTGSHEVRGSSPLCSTIKSVGISTILALFFYANHANCAIFAIKCATLCATFV